MKASRSWISDYVDLPADVSTHDLTHRLTMLGLKLEGVEGGDISGPLVVGRVLTMQPEPQKNGKTINWCSVDVGAYNDTHGTDDTEQGVGIVCGAHNFAPGDLVVVILPGGVLPGNFQISARKTYGHISNGMICSAQELGLGDDHEGIIVLPPDAGAPGDDAITLLGLDDEVIELEVNPDRAYGLSLRGIARDTALGFDVAFHDPCDRETPAADDAGYPVRVEDATGCPVFVARRVTGFDPAATSPDWLQRRLTAAGMRPISLAVDITNYVMLETGRPIHGYDGDLLSGSIVVRRAREGERLTTLDGADRALHPDDLVVCDDSGIIGLGGVMGGETTEMSAATTHVVVEAAHWDPVSMFRTGKRHKLTSEAGKRNERGVDPTICEAAADRVVELLVELGGGTAEPGVTVVGTPPEPARITLADDLAARVSGIAIAGGDAERHLVAVGCTVRREGSDLHVVPPPWRPDLNDPFDLVEEVVRVVGYDQVPSVLPTPKNGRGLSREQRLRRRVGRAMAGDGFVEVLTFPFVGAADLERLGIGAGDPRHDLLPLANPLSAEAPAMTTTLLPGVLGAAARNVGQGLGDLALFEIAAVTRPSQGSGAPIYGVERRPDQTEYTALLKALPEQPLHLALVLTGERERGGWWGPGRAADWTDAIEAARTVARTLQVPVEVRPAAPAPWHPGRSAEIWVGNTVVGHAGELHPRVCREIGLPPRSCAAELDLETLITAALDVVPAPEFSTYPVAKEDVALVVAADVPAAAVETALRAGAGELLESVRLFDVYVGAPISDGQKSLAYSLRFRAPDRTLKEGEAARARDAAVAEATRQTGATLRGS